MTLPDALSTVRRFKLEIANSEHSYSFIYHDELEEVLKALNIVTDTLESLMEIGLGDEE